MSHDLDIIMLMRKYGEEIKLEQKQARKLESEAREAKRKRRMKRS